MDKQMKERNSALDIAKGVGIILVVLGHCPQVWNPLKQFIYSFHMPLFFVISGMVWNRASHEARGYFNKGFLVGKIKRLIVPCFCWGFFYLALDALLHRSFSIRKVAYLLYGSQMGFSRAGSLTSLWFLSCIFIAVCLFEIVMSIFKSENSLLLFLMGIVAASIGCFLPKITIGYPWCADVAFVALAFMLWGYLGKRLIDRIDNTFIMMALSVLSGAFLLLSFRYNLRFISINNVDMAGRHFGLYALYFCDAMAGVLSVLLISKMLSKNIRFFRGLSYLGRRTIPVFVIHKPLVQILGKTLPRFGFPTVFTVLLCTVIAIGISIGVYIVLNGKMRVVFGEYPSNANLKK